MLKTISITVSGKVQGVFFRQSTREKALAIGINGFVSNNENGTVYILATGTAEQLEELTAWCEKGPPRAEVTGIDVKDLPLQLFNRFSIERY